MQVSTMRLVIIAAALAVAVSGQEDLVANLDYGSFQGAYSDTYNISYWQKIPFAAPPVGENRFRAPQPPLPVEGVYDSSKTFDMCPQRTVNGSEDCLYLGLYGRPWTKDKPLRPVIVTFYGGAFIQGSATFTLPPSAYPILNVSSTADLIFVYPNYRVNAFGFLPGREVAADAHSDINAGLLDQEFVLKWVRSHVHAFGGDPDNVAVWGQSAGAGSVVAQAISRPHDPPLFNKALASSPFWPKTYRYDSEEAQDIYDSLANLTGCAGPDSLRCLKSVDVQTIRDANLIIAASHQSTTSSYTWAPVTGDDFLPRTLTEATSSKGHLNIVNGFGMYNAHEGESFVPAGLNSETDSGTPAFNSSVASFNLWLKGYLPRFNKCDLQRVKKLYPRDGTTDTTTYNTTYARAGLVYRDTVLACPAYWMAGGTSQGSWLGEYTIPPALHGSDTYWWNRVNAAQKEDPLHYHGYAGAFASFFRTGDPNAFKLTAPEVAALPSLDDNEEWIMNVQGFDTTRLTQFEQRCRFWRTMALKLPI